MKTLLLVLFSLAIPLSGSIAIEPEINWKTYVDTLFQGHSKEHDLITLALKKAEETMDTRLDGMNEFRHQLDKQSENFATRDMLIPLIEFKDKFTGMLIGFGIGITVLNCIISILITLSITKIFNKLT